MLGQIDAVYDRAALVALPKDMRDRYTQHLVAITGNAPQLLIAFAYDQSLMDGPPFSVSSEEIDAHYAAHFDIEDLETVLSRNLKGIARFGSGLEHSIGFRQRANGECAKNL